MENEFIAVATNSAPVPLTPGLWYVGVVNRETTNVSYRVRATEILDTNIVVLASCMPYTNSIGAHSNVYFVLPVPNNAVQANFEFSVSTNLGLSLYVRRELTLPQTNDSWYALTNATAGASAQLPIVYTSTNHPLTAGYWFVTLVNTNDEAVDYQLQGDLFLWQFNPMVLQSGVALTNSIVARTSGCDDQFYAFPVSGNATWVAFEIHPLVNEGVSFFVKQGLPLPNGNGFAYSAVAGGDEREPHPRYHEYVGGGAAGHVVPGSDEQCRATR